MANPGVSRTKLWALFRLRGKLTLRQFTQERGRIIGAIIALLVFGPLVIGGAIGSAIGYVRLPQPWPAQLLGLVLAGLWLAWILLPVVAFNLNEGMDFTRLIVYPLTRRELLLSTLLGTLFDYPTYLMLPLFIAILVGWGVSAALPVVLVALLLSYGHMILASQIVITATGGILRSRRFRDVFIIITALVGSSCYFLQQGAIRVMTEYVKVEQVQDLRPLNVLQWVPPGAAARAIERATAGEWLSSLLWLLYAAVWLLVVAWVWWRLAIRIVTGEGFLLSLPVRERKEEEERRVERPAGERSFAARLLAFLPADVAQLAVKELKSNWRVPRRRVGLIQAVLLPFIMAGAVIFGSDDGLPTQFSSWFGAGLPLYGLFIFWVMGQNMLGMEGKGLSSLLLTPVPRQRIFLAKGMALLAMGAGPLLLVGVILTVATDSALSVAGLVTALAVGLVALGVASVASVYFAFPVNLESTRTRTSLSVRGGCLAGLANTVLVPAVMGALSLPVAIPLGLALWFDQPLLGLALSPAGVVYGIVLFWLGTRIAGQRLLRREAEVIEATRLPEGSE